MGTALDSDAMDSERVSKFPFLEEAHDFVDSSGADLDELLTSPSYQPARERGVQRVMDALEHSEVSYVPMARAGDYDRLMEVLSYPYARMLVSAVGDRFLTRRYALAEAVRMNRILAREDRETAMEVSEQLGVPSAADPDGIMRVRFTDYLRLANRLKSVDWKLINNEVHSGMVHLPQDKFSRLMQNALQDRIEAELPLMAPEEFREAMAPDVNRIVMKLAETKARFTPSGGDLKDDCLPPCMAHLLQMSKQGANLPHSARFALVAFLNTLGLDYDRIIAIFSESPDFDESIAGYQIRHITEMNGGEGYTPPECATMKTNGICWNPDNLCEKEWMTHPLKYYRFKAKPRGEQGSPPPSQRRRTIGTRCRSPQRNSAKSNNEILQIATIDI